MSKKQRESLEILVTRRDVDNLNFVVMQKGSSTTFLDTDCPVRSDLIRQLCEKATETMGSFNLQETLRGLPSDGLMQETGEVLGEMKTVGRAMFNHFLPIHLKELLGKGKNTDLSLWISSESGNLLNIPWELLFDGEEFLCLKFNMGRYIGTPVKSKVTEKKVSRQKLRMLIIADPTGGLGKARNEAESIKQELEEAAAEGEWQIEVKTLSGKRNLSDLICEVGDNYHIVHFIGHSVFDPEEPERNGWVLSMKGGEVEEICPCFEISNISPAPLFVFSNSCDSGTMKDYKRTHSNWEEQFIYDAKSFGLASAFAMSGVKHYIGTFCKILDKPSAHFAVEFYKSLFSGNSMGSSLRMARKSIQDSYGFDQLFWAPYMLYGDPAFTLKPLTRRRKRAAGQLSTLKKIIAAKDNWVKRGCKYPGIDKGNLLDQARRVMEGGIEIDEQSLTFLLLVSIHNGYEMRYWAEKNSGNTWAIHYLADALCVGYTRPPLRAAFILQLFDKEHIGKALEKQLSSSFTIDQTRELAGHVLADSVAQYIFRLTNLTSDSGIKARYRQVFEQLRREWADTKWFREGN